GWGVAFGLTPTLNDIWKGSFADDPKKLDDVGMSVPVFFFGFLVLAAAIVAFGAVLIENKMVPVQLPPGIEPFLPYRPLLIAALSIMAFLVLFFQVVSSFPLEDVAKKTADGKVNEKMSPEEKSKLKPDYLTILQGRELGVYNLNRSFALTLTVILMLVA